MKILGQLLRRNLRYLLVATPMYLRSTYSPIRCHILRSAYCFARYLDDVLDGDIPINEPPQRYVRRLMAQVKNKHSGNSSYIMLGKYVYHHIDRYASNERMPSGELDKLIDAMIFDRERADAQLLLSRKELDAHHLKIFASALHVTLHVTGARYEFTNIEPLAQSQASLYSLRDLENDLLMSINNIPESILLETPLNTREYWVYPKLNQSVTIRNWINDEFNHGSMQLTRLKKILAESTDSRFKATVKPLYWGLNYLSHKLRKQYKLA